jgi:protein-S-isoprenylcysteine O-methyltransferase Ste14
MSILVIAPFAIAAAFSIPTFPPHSFADFLFRVAGWICFCAGAMFRWWATLYVGGRKHRELAIAGPYSICRNPLYLGSFLLTLSIAFFLHSLTFALGLLIAAPIYLLITVPWEEARLQEVFGGQFAAYRARVPKFFPRLGLLDSPPTVPVNLDGLRGELHISLRWLWIPLLAQAVAALRVQTWWPSLWQLP